MRRVVVAGISGSGKSTLAAALARALGVAHVELDGIMHQPNWQELPDEEFRARVDEVTRADGWVVDGSYLAVRDLTWGRADTLVWFDRPRWLVMTRVTRRTLARVLTRRRLWNGNQEQPSILLSRDPDINIVLYTWRMHAHRREEILAAAAETEHAHLDVVRLRTDAEAAALVRAATARPSPPNS